MLFSISIRISPTIKPTKPFTIVCDQSMCLVGFFSYLPVGITPLCFDSHIIARYRAKVNSFKKKVGEIVAKLTAKQQRFVDEYLIDLNATQAAIRAGYSAQTAYRTGADNLRKPQIRSYIESRMAEKEAALIADQDEVLKYLTSVMRGQSRSSVVVVESAGNFISKAREMEKSPDEKERLKAAELLGKRYGLYSGGNKQKANGQQKNNLLDAISGMEEINTDDLPEVE